MGLLNDISMITRSAAQMPTIHARVFAVILSTLEILFLFMDTMFYKAPKLLKIYVI